MTPNLGVFRDISDISDGIFWLITAPVQESYARVLRKGHDVNVHTEDTEIRQARPGMKQK